MIEGATMKLNDLEKNEGGLLAKLWRMVVFENDYQHLLKFLLDRYKANGGEKSRTSVLQMFEAGKLTWKSLFFLLTKILPIKEATFCIKIKHLDGEVTEHCIKLDVESELSEKEVKRIRKLAKELNKEEDEEKDKEENKKGEKDETK